MNFRTEINSKVFPFEINHKSKILFLGSCFSDNISQKLINGGFSTTANPFGVLYNPISVKNGIEILLKEKTFSEKDLIFNKGLYHSFSHHGSFSDSSKKIALEQINNSVKENSKKLKDNTVAFLTFGTAYVYRYLQTKKIVSNCHKVPAKEFKHFMLTVQEIVSEYTTLLEQSHSQNPNIKIVFTVSPVRHWKDGAHENQLSKSILHLAISELEKQFRFVYYYPSYELVMDDLRDYRFYAKDMIHINPQAVDYIYTHFQDSFYSDNTKNIEQQVIKLKQALNHRPFNPNTKEHQEFIETTKAKIKLLKQEYPEIII